MSEKEGILKLLEKRTKKDETWREKVKIQIEEKIERTKIEPMIIKRRENLN